MSNLKQELLEQLEQNTVIIEKLRDHSSSQHKIQVYEKQIDNLVSEQVELKNELQEAYSEVGNLSSQL